MCHFPPGTSKRNAIGYRLFCHIMMNWRGRPLTGHEVIVQSIAGTTTRAGLSVHARLDTDAYPTGENSPCHRPRCAVPSWPAWPAKSSTK